MLVNLSKATKYYIASPGWSFPYMQNVVASLLQTKYFLNIKDSWTPLQLQLHPYIIPMRQNIHSYFKAQLSALAMHNSFWKQDLYSFVHVTIRFSESSLHWKREAHRFWKLDIDHRISFCYHSSLSKSFLININPIVTLNTQYLGFRTIQVTLINF